MLCDGTVSRGEAALNRVAYAHNFASLNIDVKAASVIISMLELAVLNSILPNAATMKFNTALGFQCTGTSLGFLWNEDISPARKRLGAVPASLLVLIAALTLS